MHQVRFTQAHAAIKEERVERNRPAAGNALGRCMGQLIGLAHDKGIERKAPVQRSSRDARVMLRHGFYLGRGARGGGRAAGLISGHLKMHAADLRRDALRMIENLVAIFLRNVVADKAGGNREGRNALIHM